MRLLPNLALKGGRSSLSHELRQRFLFRRGEFQPELGPPQQAMDGLTRPGRDNLAPQRKLANEKPRNETIRYDTLLKTWTAAAQPPKKG